MLALEAHWGGFRPRAHRTQIRKGVVRLSVRLGHSRRIRLHQSDAPRMTPRRAGGVMTDIGRVLAVLGAVLLVAGLGIMLLGRLNLPGDLVIRRSGLTVIVPIATSLVLSIVLTVVLNLLFRSRSGRPERRHGRRKPIAGRNT